MTSQMVSTTIYIYERQALSLKQLRARTRVPIAEYIRQGIELLLEEQRESGAIKGTWDAQIPLALKGNQNDDSDKSG